MRRHAALICSAEVLGMGGFATFAALVPTFVADWGLSNTDVGWISGIFFAGYMGIVPVLVSLTDRTDPRRIYLIFTALGGFSTLGYALLAEGFWSALFFRTVSGVALAGTYMPGLKLLSGLTRGPSQSRFLSFYTSSFSVGAAVSFFLSGAVAGSLGWKWAFGAAALGSAASFFIVRSFVPALHLDRSKVPPTHLLDFRPVFRNRLAMGFVLAYGAHAWELFAQRSWIVAFLVFSQSLQSESYEWFFPATVVAALTNLVGVPASIVGNELAIRFDRVRMVTFIMVGSAVVSFGIGFSGFLPYGLVVALCLLHGVTAYGDSAAITAGAVAAASPSYQGATMAVHSFVGFGCGFLGPLIFGVILDLAGGSTSLAWGLAFASLGVTAVMGPVALAALSRSTLSR